MDTILASPNFYKKDALFDSIYPSRIQQLSKIHWTPLKVAKKATSFLAFKPGTKILDVGSGVGKFCISGAHYYPDSEFHGVEQRKDLVDYAVKAKELCKTTNVRFFHSDFTSLGFEKYNSIYFFNSFCENLYSEGLIDECVARSADLFVLYSSVLFHILREMSSGTRLVTYHVIEQAIPNNYKLIDCYIDGYLKMWIKE